MDQDTDHTPALLFDLDGTLIDSVYQHVLAWHEALEELGLSLAVWRIHRRIGMSGGLLVQALGREIGQKITPQQAQELQKRHAVIFPVIAEPFSRFPEHANCCNISARLKFVTRSQPAGVRKEMTRP